MHRSIRICCGLVLIAGSTLSAHALDRSVARSLNGLPATDTLIGGATIGLRGASPDPINSGTQAWVGILEVDSDNRRTTTFGQATNGFDQTHPALNGVFGPVAPRIQDEVGDALPAAGAPAGTAGHATTVAGIILSRNGTHTGMAPRALGVMGMSDDIARLFIAGTKQAPDPAIRADWAQMEASLNYIKGQPVDVINASLWYNSIPTGAATTRAVTQADLNGTSFPGLMFDRASHVDNKVMVVGAGNSGPGVLSLTADIYNGIVVGAIDAVPAGGGIADIGIASYSARGPLAGGRNGVMIVAPGTNITSTAHDHAGANPDFRGGNSGTSFAAPHVSGAAAILRSAAFQANSANARTDRNDPFSTNQRVIKAVLLNSARKIGQPLPPGQAGPPSPWSPGQVAAGDPTTWVHPLNYDTGAGELDTREAWRQFRESTITGPGVKTTGYWWDAGTIDIAGGATIYESGSFNNWAAVPLNGFITSLTATVSWDRHVTNLNAAAPGLSNINLFLEYSTDLGNTWTKILSSESPNDSTEHLHLENMPNFNARITRYRLRVEGPTFAAGVTSEDYAIAVRYTAVPTPGAMALLALAGVVAGRRRRA